MSPWFAPTCTPSNTRPPAKAPGSTTQPRTLRNQPPLFGVAAEVFLPSFGPEAGAGFAAWSTTYLPLLLPGSGANGSDLRAMIRLRLPGSIHGAACGAPN